MVTLTPEQMEEAVEAMARAYSGAPFPSPRSRDKARAALTAALPVIERAVLNHVADWIKTQRNIVPANGWEFEEPIRALAGEER